MMRIPNRPQLLGGDAEAKRDAKDYENFLRTKVEADLIQRPCCTKSMRR
jgi:hypothetical protein